MTEEEYKAKIAELEKANKQYEANIAKQNSYITKLEAKANNSEPAQQVGYTPTGVNPSVQAYLEKSMRRDVITEAKGLIKQEISEEVYNAVEPDFLAFLDKNLKNENCTTAYVVDAFSLVMGRALRNKEHAINKIGKGTQTPPATPTQTTNSSQVQAVQNTIISTPPVMGTKDISAVSGIPEPNGNPVNSTKDAFKNLKARFNNLGGNRFN